MLFKFNRDENEKASFIGFINVFKYHLYEGRSEDDIQPLGRNQIFVITPQTHKNFILDLKGQGPSKYRIEKLPEDKVFVEALTEIRNVLGTKSIQCEVGNTYYLFDELDSIYDNFFFTINKVSGSHSVYYLSTVSANNSLIPTEPLLDTLIHIENYSYILKTVCDVAGQIDIGFTNKPTQLK